MAIEVECPICGEEYRLPPKAAGRSFRCKSCDESIPVPGGRRRRPSRPSRPPAESGRLPPKRRREVAEKAPPSRSASPRRAMSLEERIEARNDEDGSLAAEGMGHILRGLLFVALGVGGWFLFAAMEADGGGGRVPIILLFLYKLGGKFLVAAAFGGTGLVFLVMGIVHLVQSGQR